MEDWEIDFEWLRVRHFIQDQMAQTVLPDMNAILILVGMQEIGRVIPQPTKEQKQDLMHVATCALLSLNGHYKLDAFDDEGWPHYRLLHRVEVQGEAAQEKMLKTLLVQYFREQGL